LKHSIKALTLKSGKQRWLIKSWLVLMMIPTSISWIFRDPK
jgi:hypothetical protein